MSQFILRTYAGIDNMHPDDWGQLEAPNFPFANHAFLLALEQSGSVSTETGWTPKHLTLWKEGKLVGASPIYSKQHSYGEYIFDWAWAEAYQRHHIAYYPKLTASTPFTPATGPKVLVRHEKERAETYAALLAGAREHLEKTEASSLHYLFIQKEEIPFFERAGFLIRNSFQYHWRNHDYRSFQDFLGALKPRKRKQIQRERDQLAQSGLKIRILTGSALAEEHALKFYAFYRATTSKMQAIAYLTPDFFRRVFESMRDSIVLILAEDGTTAVAASLLYQKGSTLFGRYWGAEREVRNLHFELCYYQPVEWAIARGLKLFEAGAQGEHKISRGFVPELTYSAHWIVHPGFREAIAGFVEEEKAGIEKLFKEMAEHTPYRCF